MVWAAFISIGPILSTLNGLQMDKSKPRIFVYHAKHKPKIVYLGEEQAYYDDGWCDSPAKCKGFLDKVGVSEDDEMGVQIIAEKTEEVKNDTNDALNLELMSAKELKAYARKHLPELKYAKNATKKTMLELIG